MLFFVKELSLLNKIKYLNLNIFRFWCCKPLIFQTQIIWSNRIHSLKYLRSATFGSKDIEIRKSKFVAKTQFLLTFVYLFKCVFLHCLYRFIRQYHNSKLKIMFLSAGWRLYRFTFLFILSRYKENILDLCDVIVSLAIDNIKSQKVYRNIYIFLKYYASFETRTLS